MGLLLLLFFVHAFFHLFPIFNHLIRQSDPGIQWQMEEDGEEMEESMDEEEEEGEGQSTKVNGTSINGGEVENGSDAGDDSDGDGNEGKEVTVMEDADEIVEDPRAGVGDAIIPQINVNYLQLSERLFELGSGNGIKKANRDALYKVSKMLKDVANDLFPLGPNLSDEDIDIPKINVKKSAKDLLKRNEEILKKNLEDKIRNKSLMSKMSEKAKEIDASVNKSESEDDDGSTGPEKDGIDHESSSDEDTNEAVQKEKKLSSKELRRKRKQEQKKRKREKALALEQEKAEKMKQAQKMIENDMERKAAMEPVKIGGVIEDKKEKIEQRTEKLKTIEKKKKKKGGQQNGFEVTNDSETVKELIKLAEDLEEKSDVSVKKKKKKKDKNITENGIVNASKESTDLVQSLNKSDREESNENESCVNVSEEGVDPTLSASKKKKKK